MKTITRAEAELWCKTHSVVLSTRALPDRPSANEFSIPQDAGARIALVASTMAEFRDAVEFLVWFDDWSVWPSGQRMHVFEKFRLGYGETRSISIAPAHIFEAAEIEDAISFVTVAVLFLWDCYVVTDYGKKVLFFSHDEWGAAMGVVAPPSDPI